MAIAGVTRKDEWTRQKLYQAKCKDKAGVRFSGFFEKAFVSDVKHSARSRWNVGMRIEALKKYQGQGGGTHAPRGRGWADRE